MNSHQNVEPSDGHYGPSAWQLLESCGQGSFGKVYLAVNRYTEEICAIKRVAQNRQYKNRENEVITHLQLPHPHPNIVRLISSHFDDSTDSSDNTTKRYLNLVMEYLPFTLADVVQYWLISGMPTIPEQAPGLKSLLPSLPDYSSTAKSVISKLKNAAHPYDGTIATSSCKLTKQCSKTISRPLQQNLYQPGLDETSKEPWMLHRIVCFQLLRAVAYLHCRGYTHRDIKPQNVLVEGEAWRVRLCDFGSAKHLHPEGSNVAYICSRYYRAPELMHQSPYYSSAVDNWSVGCVIAELFTGCVLFTGENTTDQFIKVWRVLGLPTQDDLIAMRSQNLLKSEHLPTMAHCGLRKHLQVQRRQSLLVAEDSGHHRSVHNSTCDSDCHGRHHPPPVVTGHPTTTTCRGLHHIPSEQFIPEATVDLLQGLLIYDPNRRLTAAEALAHPFFDPIRHEGLYVGDTCYDSLFDLNDTEVAAFGLELTRRILPAGAENKPPPVHRSKRVDQTQSRMTQQQLTGEFREG